MLKLNRREILRLLGIAGIAAALPSVALTPHKGEPKKIILPNVTDNIYGSVIDYPENTIERFPVRYQLVKIEKPYRKYRIAKDSPVFWKDKANFIATPKIPNPFHPSMIAGIFLNDYAINGDAYWIQVSLDANYVKDASAISKEKAKLLHLASRRRSL